MFNRILLKLRLAWFRYRGWPHSQKLNLPEYSHERKVELLHSLAEHPGFQFLMAHIERSKAIYEGQRRPAIAAGLKGLNGVIADHTEAVRNEEAIFWIGFLQYMVKKYSAMPDLKGLEADDPRRAT